MTNAAKHAHASVVNVELNTYDAILRLAIHDDGLATHYDKHAVIYRGAVVLAAIMLWLP